MRVAVLGVNHRSAPLFVQEVFARACEKLFHTFQHHPFIDGYLLLATCNRTEIYFTAYDLAEAHSDFLRLLKQEISMAFDQYVYSFFGLDCFEHLCSVICGLDSAIIAESDIQGQVKKAYENARKSRYLSSSFHFLFQKALKISKEIRTRFPIPKGLLTLEKIIFHLSEAIYKEIEEASLLFIGNSQTNRKIFNQFRAKGIKNITFCTQTEHSALDWLNSHKVPIIDRSQLSFWEGYDIIISATKSTSYIVPNTFRLSRKRLLFDLSVPRNIDPKLALHPQHTLFNLEKLSKLLEKERTIHHSELEKARSHLHEAARAQFNLSLFKEKQRESLNV